MEPERALPGPGGARLPSDAICRRTDPSARRWPDAAPGYTLHGDRRLENEWRVVMSAANSAKSGSFALAPGYA